MTAFRQRSSDAASLDEHARHYVDEVDRRHYDGRIPPDTAADIYRQAVGSEAQRRMMEDLEPIQRALGKFAALTIGPMPPVPPHVQALIDHITGKWQRDVAELLGDKP